MKRPKYNPIFTILLYLAAAFFAIFALKPLDHPPGSWTVTIMMLGLFSVFYLWALLRTLQARDEQRAEAYKTQNAIPTPPRPELEGTAYGLTPGIKYKVVRSFKDFYGKSFNEHEVLTFKEQHFLPYHGGYTIIFVEISLFLQENTNKDILENFSEYIVKLT